MSMIPAHVPGTQQEERVIGRVFSGTKGPFIQLSQNISFNWNNLARSISSIYMKIIEYSNWSLLGLMTLECQVFFKYHYIENKQEITEKNNMHHTLDRVQIYKQCLS